jgi:hypothetical protein
MIYASIGPIRAHNVRLDASASVSGLPPLTGIMGCVDVLRRQFAGDDPAADAPSCPDVLIVLHDVQVRPGRFKPSPNHKAAPTEVQETMEGTVEFTLIVRGLEVSGARAARGLVGKRFCGGNVVLLPAALRDRDGADLAKILSSLPPGRVLLDRRDLLERDLPGDPLDRILHYLTWVPADPDEDSEASVRIQDGDSREHSGQAAARDADGQDSGKTGKPDKKPELRRPEPGWLVPIAVGYQALESYDESRFRSGTRDPDTPHLFVEDLIGLGELVSTRILARRLRADLGQDGIFWKWRIDLDRGEFLVTARA